MIRTPRPFLRDQAGGIAIAAALAAPVVLMLAGGAADVQRAEAARVELQDALDAAALSGAMAGSEGDPEVARQSFAANSGFTDVQPEFTADDGVVTGAAAYSVPATFLKIIGVDSLPVSVATRALAGVIDPVCLLLLDKTTRALEANSDADLVADGCPIHVNSNHAEEAAVANSGSTIRAESFCVVGAVRANSATISPAAKTGCAPAPDPFARVADPVVSGSCQDARAQGAGTTVRLTPGCYRNVNSDSGGTIIFEPGVYKLTGEVRANSRSTIQGDDVTLFFTGYDGRLQADADSTVDLSASRSGDHAGFVIFQSPFSAASRPFVFNSGVAGKLEGVVYLPKAEQLELSANVTSTANYTVVVAQKLYLNSRADLTLNSNYDAATPLPQALRAVRLDQ